MLCIRPFRVRPGLEYGCGQCLPCRINRRRMWTARLVLEMASSAMPTAFIGLTYHPKCLPEGGTLVPKHFDEFRQKLRNRIGRFRYYAVGEYGEKSGRAHYHVLVFGNFPEEEFVQRCWKYGNVDVQVAGFLSTAYVAGYVTKKMTGKDDPRLAGRHPEFARMSLKPGIGVPGLWGIMQWLYSDQGAAFIGRNHDVPKVVRFEGAIYPLGRYLVQCLRNEFGIPAQDAGRSLLREALRLDQLLPEVLAKRELRREGYYQRAQFYKSLRLSKEKL